MVFRGLGFSVGIELGHPLTSMAMLLRSPQYLYRKALNTTRVPGTSLYSYPNQPRKVFVYVFYFGFIYALYPKP